MTARVFVDTNVLVYLFDDHEAQKQRRANDVLRELGRFVLSAQVLGEFYVTVTRKLRSPLSPALATSLVSDFAAGPVIQLDSALVRAAIDSSERSQLSYWDALIIEAAVAGGCDRILTEDLDAGSVIRGVEIVDPFA
jgi:predicted nucleic acid-binding protein